VKLLDISPAGDAGGLRTVRWNRLYAFIRHLVYRLAYNDDVVAFKMGRRQGGPNRTGARGRISKPIRNRRATRLPAHFQRNPLGRSQLAVFLRCSLLTYQLDMLVARDLKNSQLTCGDITIICETVHKARPKES
jgi:hypothetical protein